MLFELKKSADGGNIKSTRKYYQMIMNGMRVPVNKKGTDYYLKIIIDKDHVDKIIQYKTKLENKEDASNDKNVEVHHFMLSIEIENVDSMNKYETIFINGDRIPIDESKISFIFTK